MCVCCYGSVAAVLEHWRDKVGHGETQAHRTAALQTALEEVGVSNRELAAPMNSSTAVDPSAIHTLLPYWPIHRTS